jgi:hypothetical protein
METIKKLAPWVVSLAFLATAILSGLKCEKLKESHDSLITKYQEKTEEVVNLKKTVTTYQNAYEEAYYPNGKLKYKKTTGSGSTEIVELQKQWSAERDGYLSQIKYLQSKTTKQFVSRVLVGYSYDFKDELHLPCIGYKPIKLEYRYKKGDKITISNFHPGIFFLF